MYKGRRLVLASASPRRKELLESLGLQFKIAPSQVDEEIPPHLPAAEVAEHLAFLKAEAVASGERNAVVIGADTLVLCNGRIIGKPGDRSEAVRILTRLSGTRHSVLTGLCIIDTVTGKVFRRCQETVIRMRRISEAEIEEYVDSGRSMGKSGAYAIQEEGDRFVESVDGSFSNVVGLPLELLKEMLEGI